MARMREAGRQADLLLRPPVRQFGMTEVRAFDRIVQAGGFVSVNTGNASYFFCHALSVAYSKY